MKTHDSNISERIQKSGGTPVNAGKNRITGSHYSLDYVCEKIKLTSKVPIEAFKAAQQKFDTKKVEQVYTQRLLDLTTELNTRASDNGLGSKVAKDIHSKYELFNPFTSICLIEYMINKITENCNENEKCKEETARYISNLPSLVESIKGKNGADSDLLRYRFVSKVLPKIDPDDTESANTLAQEFIKRETQNPTSASEDAKYMHQRCHQLFEGDSDKLMNFLVDGHTTELNSLLKKCKSAYQANYIDPISGEQ